MPLAAKSFTTFNYLKLIRLAEIAHEPSMPSQTPALIQSGPTLNDGGNKKKRASVDAECQMNDSD